MKLLTILSLILMSLGASAQTNFIDLESFTKSMKERGRENREKARSFNMEKVAQLDNGGNARLKITGDGSTAKVSVLITTYGSASIKSNIRTQRTTLYKKKFHASNLEQMKSKIANGVQLELDALFTDGTAELSAKSNSDVVDFYGAGQSISFDL